MDDNSDPLVCCESCRSERECPQVTSVTCYIYRAHAVTLTVLSEPHHDMGVKIGDYDLDTSNISPADVEQLRKMLPTELQQPGKLTQLEIILEAIHYIQMLQSKLSTKEP